MRLGRGIRGIRASWVRDLVSGALACERSVFGRAPGFRRRVSVFLTGNQEIRWMNKKYLHHDAATDVLAFGCGPRNLAERGSDYLGDIAVSMEMAKTVAREMKIPWREELARYLVHGTLHLLGYQDHKDLEAALLWKRQEAILAKILNVPRPQLSTGRPRR